MVQDRATVTMADQ